MGIQKAIVAFVMSAVALLGYFIEIDFAVTENMVSTVVGLALTLLNTFGVYKVTNKE